MATVQFERHPHDREHPYSIISNDIIRHPTLSLDTIALLIRMLSLPSGWRMTEESLRKFGRDKPIGDRVMRRMMSELREHGYLEKVAIRDDTGKVTEWKWYVREHPKPADEKPSDDGFSQKVGNRHSGSDCVSAEKMPSQGGFSQNGGFAHCGKCTPIRKTEREEIKKRNDSLLCEPSPHEKEAQLLTEDFFNLLKARKADIKLPDEARTAKAFELMLRVDGRQREPIAQVMAWATQHEFWGNVILSGDKLRKQFDQLQLKMKADEAEYDVTQNRLLAWEAKKAGAPIIIEKRWVRNTKRDGKDLDLHMRHDAFCAVFRSFING